MEIELNYSDWKNKVDTHGLIYHSFVRANSTYLVAVDGNLYFTHKLSRNDQADYDANYKPSEGGLASPRSKFSKLPKVTVQGPDGDFNTYVTHNFCDNTTWTSTSNSEWICEPSPGKVVYLVWAEVQFTHDISLSGTTSMNFDIWAYDPSNLPNRALVERITYSSIRNALERGNAHYTLDAGVDGETEKITTIKFDYPRAIPLQSSLGMQIRVTTDSHTEVGGTYMTASFITSEEDE